VGGGHREEGGLMSIATHADSLLVELFVEELPPKALKKLGDAFARLLFEGLKAQGLAGPHSATTSFATPRRLAAHISAVAAFAQDEETLAKLMPRSVALDPLGKPTQALRRRLAKEGCGDLADAWPDGAAGEDRLMLQGAGKDEAMFLQRLAKGKTLREGLQQAIDGAITNVPIPKLMTYQLETGPLPGWSNAQFVRPAHGLVALHGAELVPVTALGLSSRRETHGHRFEAPVDPVVLQHADRYAQQLREQGAVVASFEQRRGEIVRQLQHRAAQQGLRAIDDAALLDEVTALVERPNVLLGRFDESFLDVPPECLILTMKANQRYFPMLDVQGRLTSMFLIVSNCSPADPKAIVSGNERVVRARLADAKFFFDQDRKTTLESRVEGLTGVVYHNKLGSQGERALRVRAIARSISAKLGDADLVDRADLAARLAKTDLLTGMVGEFPELQGTMGRYYAQYDGLADDVAFAIEDHYRPRFAGDELPRNEVGLVVALADKLETLVGMFGIGQLPTGDKDPFALRRHALGVIRMLIEKDLPIDLAALIDAAWQVMHRMSVEGVMPSHGPKGVDATLAAGVDLETDTPSVLSMFFYDRLAGSLREQGYTAQEVDAALTLKPQRLGDVPRRLAAVRAFAAMPEAPALASANKRVGNILKKAEGDVDAKIVEALLKEPAEAALAQALAAITPVTDAAFARGDYTASLQALAALKGPVDAFFNGVLVNVEDPALRANRLGLLATLHAAMNRVADLSKLAV
jgi:glycyl-tRNA synthetase beta chain